MHGSKVFKALNLSWSRALDLESRLLTSDVHFNMLSLCFLGDNEIL